MAKSKKADSAFGKKPYKEWKVEIIQVDGKKSYDKLKVVRERVLITDEQAEILNDGLLNGPDNKLGLMYFLPEN